MTRRAVQVVVLAEQRKWRQVVIEKRYLCPACFRMAILARLPLRSGVHIVVEVTRQAIEARRRRKDGFDVAINASDVPMRSIEAEIGIARVIKLRC